MRQEDGAGALVGYQLKRAQSALRSRMDDALRPLGLTTPQYACLERLRHQPGASGSDLARSVFVTRQTMNTLLQSLEDRGLVRRATSPTSGRTLPAQLTPTGEALVVRAIEAVEQIEHSLVSRLSASEARALWTALQTCADTLEHGSTDPS